MCDIQSMATTSNYEKVSFKYSSNNSCSAISLILRKKAALVSDVYAVELLVSEGEMTHRSRPDGELTSFVEKIQSDHCYCCCLAHI